MTGSSSHPRVHKHTNRLVHSTSPYLIQHAHNPVDWFPWGDEAFEQARQRNVPIFLSIGYSTCYWCHVMERESFEDESTARIMNEKFVCIKLDREERPDLDELYMSATVLMRGHGGWPMSVFLEPDTLRPFFCGTYFPKNPHPNMRGPTFTQVLEGMSQAYHTQRTDVREQAEQLAQAVEEHLGSTDLARTALGVETVQEALSRILAMFDKVQGGFGVSPKFPQPVFLEFLLDARDAVDSQTRAAIDHAVRTTLDAMAKGGIHDHLGGGFHRYSVDASWTVPHFEKMLYDQAQLLSVYAQAAIAFDDAWYADVCESLVEYLKREMIDPKGGFFSAQDAEVNGQEGLNYLWTPDEVRAALGNDADFAIKAFGLDEPANFVDPHHPHAQPTWVLRLKARPEQLAHELVISPAAFVERLSQAKAKLLSIRNQRKQPATDTKILTSWNCMMACALETYGRLLNNAEAIALAKSTVQTILTRLQGNQNLLRTARGDKSHTPAFLEDYAWAIRACAAVGLKDKAAQLADSMKSLFSTHSQWFDTRQQQSDVFVRACATHDGANPSGFASAAHALLDTHLVDDAATALASQSVRIAASPAGCVESVRALLRLLRPIETHRDAARRAIVMLTAVAQPTNTTNNTSRSETPDVPDLVHIYASAERVTISQDTPGMLTLVVEVEPHHHVIAAQPWDDATSTNPQLIPFRVDIHNGSGVAVYADYPKGELLAASTDQLPAPRVYTGRLEIPVVLERIGEWNGTPLLTIRYQVCNANTCFAPMMVELDIALDRA